MGARKTKRNNKGRYSAALAMCIFAGSAPAETTSNALTEDGYVGDLPVVLSVTRLAQSQADTPAAVTVIDRDMIRRSGARTIDELLRFVPGFMVSAWNGANPIVAYHAQMDNYGARLQVFIDGRSVYSSLMFGDTHRGMADVILEDVDRIEVLRGSNSAAFGSNAFLGVINIVTKNAADTRGTLISTNIGNDGISDQTLRYGWGTDDTNWRITAARRFDQGDDMRRVYPSYFPQSGTIQDNTELSQMHLRGDLRLSPQDDLQLELGGSRQRADDGDGTLLNPTVTAITNNGYALARWNRQLSSTESISLSANFDSEVFQSLQYVNGYAISPPFPFNVQNPIALNTSGTAQRTEFEFSHTLKPLDTVRTVWGVSWRGEDARSPAMFNTDQTFSQTQTRVFGNLEWRIVPKLLLNAGGLIEKDSVIGTNFAPRVMFNWQPLPEHTFRIGMTRANDTPPLLAIYGNNPIRNPDPATASFVPILRWDTLATGNAGPEHIYTREVGWLGDFREIGLTIDVRGYYEQMTGLLRRVDMPGATSPLNRSDFVNQASADTRGVEYQMNWRPREGTRLMAAQSYTRVTSDQYWQTLALETPRVLYSLAWFQDWPREWSSSLMYSHTGSMTWARQADTIPGYGILSTRWSKRFTIGSTRNEVALTAQNIDGGQYQYLVPSPLDPLNPGSGHPIVPVAQRRVFLTLRTEY
jgi:iron complex outermembrane receptor protein